MPVKKLDISEATIEELTTALTSKIRLEHNITIPSLKMRRFADSGIKTVKPLFEEKVATLNKVEHCLLETRALIRRSLNQESMLLRLPEEIIVKIFLSYNEDHHYPGFIGSASAGNLEQLGRLLIPSQICSSLRQVCLGAPGLWSEINLLWPVDVIDAYTIRARGAGLSLTVPACREREVFKSQEVFEQRLQFCANFLPRNMHMIRSLDLTILWYRDLNGIDALWNSIRHLPAPRLESCMLSGRSWEERYSLDGLFSHEAPFLKELVVASYTFHQFDLSPFQSLTILDLYFDDPASLESISQIPRIVSRCPRLRTLRLCGPDNEGIVEYVEPLSAPVTELSDCVDVDIAAFFSDHIVYLLSAISLPSVHDLTIEGIVREAEEERPYKSIYSSLPASFKENVIDSQLVTFGLQGFGTKLRTMTGKRFNLDLAERQSMQFGDAWTSATISEFIAGAFQEMQLKPKTISFVTDEHFPVPLYTRDTWKTIFLAASSVDRIISDGYICQHPFLEALTESNLMCPSLQFLDLRGPPPDHINEDDAFALIGREGVYMRVFRDDLNGA